MEGSQLLVVSGAVAVRSCNSDGSSEQSAMRSEEVRAGSSKKKRFRI